MSTGFIVGFGLASVLVIAAIVFQVGEFYGWWRR